MRLLFTFAGGTGHFVPLAVLATAAVEAGHEVAFACQTAMLRSVESAGFAAFDTGGPTLRTEGVRTPLLELDEQREELAITRTFAGSVARTRATALLELCDTSRPDLIIHDEVDYGSTIAAELLDIPHANVLIIAAGVLTRASLITEPLNRLRAEFGLPTHTDLNGELVLSPFPPGFRDPAHPLPPNAHSIRPLFFERPTTVPDVRDAVYVTLGTIFNLESGDLFERVLSAVAELRRDVVVTVGNELDPTSVGPTPPNVRVLSYVPQCAILPKCRAVISHAGSGSVMGALVHGLPSVLLPMGADQPHNAARCATLGVGRVLDALRATPGDIRESLIAVLEDSTYRRAAARLQQEIACLPGPDYALRLLEQIAR